MGRESRTCTGQSGTRSKKIEVDLQRRGAAARAGEGQPPLSSGVVAGRTPHLDLLARADGVERLLDPGPLGEHDLAAHRSDVVQVDIDRETWQIEEEEVQRRATLERHAVLQERMDGEILQDSHEADDLLERLRLEARDLGHSKEIGMAQRHRSSCHCRSSTASETMRFQSFISLPETRRLSR